jgi:peptidase M1-like protein
MPRLALAAVMLALQLGPGSQQPQNRPLQADGVVRLLTDLEAALVSGRVENFRALSSSTITDAATNIFQGALAGGNVSTAALRERLRRPMNDGFEVLAEVLVSHGRQARLATWLLAARPRGGGTDRYEVADLVEPAAVDGLLKLTLDRTKQFTVRNLTLEAPDFVVKMTEGSAFVAEDGGGPTAIVLRGKGEVQFSPPDAAEQGQLKIFSGRPAFRVPFESAFVRINSAEFSDRVSAQSLTPSPVDSGELSRAQAIFDELSRRTYHIDLRDLSPERWSLGPTNGSVVIEFKTQRWGWLTYVRSPNEPEDIAFFDRTRSRTISSYTSAERLVSRGRAYGDDDDLPYDIERYGIEATFDPERQWISGRGSIRLKIRSVAVTTLTFKLAESLVVSSVTSPNFGRLLALRVVNQNNVIVNLPTVVPRDTELIFDIVYGGRLNSQTIERDAALQVQQVGGQDPSQVIIEPEPRFLYSSQAYWYPQSTVSDYATAALRLRVPSQYQIIASGSLVRSTVGPDDESALGRGSESRFVRTVEYSTDRPARFLSCVISRFSPTGRMRVPVPALAPAAVRDLDTTAPPDTPPGVNLEVVSTPRMSSRNRQLTPRVAEMLRAFAGLVGEAPYPDFTLAGVDDNLPGGHSPALFAIWLQPLPTTPYSWTSDPLALDMIYPPYYLAHEVAHQWWGQAVGWKNYHEQWLSEGLAQYFSVLYANTDRGPETMRDMLTFMRASAASYSPKGPISLGYRLGHVQGDARIFRAIIYNKSATVLHMLRRLIGDEAFFSGIRRFYQAWRFRRAGTQDFRAAMAAGSPLPLERFFERWIYGTALPRLRVTSRIEPSGEHATIRIEQIGDVFDLPYTVTIQYLDGRSEDVTIPVLDSIVEQRIALKGALKRLETKDELALATFVK